MPQTKYITKKHFYAYISQLGDGQKILHDYLEVERNRKVEVVPNKIGKVLILGGSARHVVAAMKDQNWGIDLGWKDLTGAVLGYVDLSNAFWAHAKCDDVDFRRTVITNGVFANTSMLRVNLQDVECLGVSFWRADLRGADIRGTRFTSGTFSLFGTLSHPYSCLEDAILLGAKISLNTGYIDVEDRTKERQFRRELTSDGMAELDGVKMLVPEKWTQRVEVTPISHGTQFGFDDFSPC